ncbi:FMRFamide receptor-like [Pecten maximus]|uniref:FMRFamide receptor-like n=1 Tax=Pecten maximus TaxID=6579 RepID=UPI001458C9AD|nr:FMRFamide receptor-like [Pecten maximus]
MANFTLPQNIRSMTKCNSFLWNSSISIQDATIDNNTSLCNFTSAANWSVITEIDYGASWVYFYLIPIISSFGLIGNTLSFIVVIQLSRVSSFYLYLAVLALSDSVVLILLGFLYYIDTSVFLSAHKDTPRNYYSPFYICYIIFSQYSSWIIVALSVDRYIAVCHPLKVKTFCTRKRAITTTMCIFLAIFALDFPLFCFKWNDDNTSCLFPAKSIHFTAEYFNIIDLPTYAMVPVAIILVLSILIIRGLYIANKRRQHLSNNLTSGRMKIKSSTLKTMVLLMATVLIFFMTSLPVICVMTYTLAADVGFTVFMHSNPYIICMIDVLSALNHAANFALYGLTGTTFREELLKLFCRSRFRGVTG